MLPIALALSGGMLLRISGDAVGQATLLTVLTLVAPPTDAVLPLRVLAAGAVQSIRIPLTTADFLRYR